MPSAEHVTSMVDLEVKLDDLDLSRSSGGTLFL